MMFHDIDQNTDDWLDMRGGKITSSSLAKVMANYGKAFGEPARKYAVEIAVSQITGESASSGYSNGHMDRGHEEEPLARAEYESEFFCNVTNGGFFDLGDIGCSPDGLVSKDGVIEIKSAIPTVHYARVVRQSFDPAYKWQLVGNLKWTEREWIDFISYCSAYPEGKRIYVHRSHKSDFADEFNMLDERLAEFRVLIDATKNRILNSNYFFMERAA